MKQPKPIHFIAMLIIALTVLNSRAAAAQPRKLKVFILAGQSNMEGHAKVETFDYIGDDPATAPLLKQMRSADGTPGVCDHVWISYFTGSSENNGEGVGKLTAGYGSRHKPEQDGGKIGPEFTFGLTLDKALTEPVLLVKTAWGGKSLHTDFRPPSAGPYQLNDYQKKLYYGPPGHGVPKDMDVWLAEKKRDTGHYYRLMVDHVKRVLADPKRVCPAYDLTAGYEIAGFVWLQGWNDMVDGHTYPDRGNPGRFAAYSDLLAHFIRGVRKDFGAPKMPFIIGVMGVGGTKAGADTIAFREAMTAPALLPEFKGNVIAVQTAPFWSEELDAIDKKREKVRQMRHFLDSKHKNYANADGKMTEEQKRELVKKFEVDLITPTEAALWKRGASNAGYHYSDREWTHLEKLYAAAITRLDSHVGRIIQELKDQGIDRQTIILFTSDNGDENSYYKYTKRFGANGPLKGRKRFLYEGGIRVPMIARWPGQIQPGQTSRFPAAGWDLMATLAELAGVARPAHTDGISLVPTLLGHAERQEARKYLYWEYHMGKQQAVRMGLWKGVRFGGTKEPVELYDLDADIGETRNVAADHPDVVKKITAIMEEARANSAFNRFWPLPEHRQNQIKPDKAIFEQLEHGIR